MSNDDENTKLMLPSHPGLRKAQKEMADTTMARDAAGEKTTVAQLAPGMGKTKGYMHTGQRMYAASLISTMCVYCPRLTLRSQAELDWEEWRPHYVAPVMGPIVGSSNAAPLVRADQFGFVSTYQSLATDSTVHLDWAQEHRGRFLLVADEIQFLGMGEDPDDGTRAATFIERMAQYARHTILTSGSLERVDGKPLALVEYSEPDARGFRRAEYHVRGTYLEGVALRYLRPPQFNLHDGEGRLVNMEQFTISETEKHLRGILSKDTIWQPMADAVVGELLNMRRLCPRYTALIGCLDQSHARKVAAYLAKKFPNLRIGLAVSDDGSEAKSVLKRFRTRDKGGDEAFDVLVTKEMVSLGFDCPSITVVGNLSATRWIEWLIQFLLRAGRMWGDRPMDEQVCIYVGLADPRTKRFAMRMRRDAEAGLRQRIDVPPPPPGEPPPGVLAAGLTSEEALGIKLVQDLSPEELAGVRNIVSGLSRPAPETLVAEIIRVAGRDVPRADIKRTGPRETAEERRKRWGRETMDALRSFVRSRYGLNPATQNDEFVLKVRNLITELNKQQGVKNVDFLTEQQWIERMRIIEGWQRSAA